MFNWSWSQHYFSLHLDYLCLFLFIFAKELCFFELLSRLSNFSMSLHEWTVTDNDVTAVFQPNFDSSAWGVGWSWFIHQGACSFFDSRNAQQSGCASNWFFWFPSWACLNFWWFLTLLLIWQLHTERGNGRFSGDCYWKVVTCS